LNTKNTLQSDVLIHAKWIIPVVPAGLVLDNHVVAIKDKKIAAILASVPLEKKIIRKKMTLRGEVKDGWYR